MKKRLSRILSLVLLVAMVMSLMPTTLAFAEEAPAEEITVPEEGVILPVAGENDPPADDPEDPFYEDELFYEDGEDYEDELFYAPAADDLMDETSTLNGSWELVTSSTQLKTDGATLYAIVGVAPETGETVVLASDGSKTTLYEVEIAGGSITFNGEDSITTDSNCLWIRESNTKLSTLASGTGTNLSTSLTMVGNNKGSKIQIVNVDSETGFLDLYTNGSNKYALSFNGTSFVMTRGSTSSGSSIKMYVFVESDEPVDPTPTAPAAPTASPAPGAVAEGTEVTISCATEGATIYTSTDGVNFDGDTTTYTIDEATTIYAYAEKDELTSDTVSFAYTIRTEADINTIAEALAGADNAEFTVKGVVTLLDAKNVFVQDATGGICLRLSAAPTDLALGDTVIGTGTKSVYKGLPQLNGTYEKSEGLTLSAKETTIGALTAADVCTYVSLSGLEVTEVYDNNGSYSAPNITVKDAENNTIQIYKAVVGKTDGAWDVKVGDTISFTGAVGIFNSDLQLRNTLASEITVTASATPDDPTPEDPYAGIEKDLNVYQLTDTIQAGDKVLIYNAGNQKAAAGEMSGYYLAGKDETVLTGTDLIATKDDKIEWTVVVNEDGSYSFTQESVALAGKQTPKDGGGYYNNVSLSASDMAAWMLTKVSETGSAYYMQNRDMVTAFENDGGHVYLEWYANKTAFSMYDTSRVSETNFGFTFYKLVREAETPDDPTPEDPYAGIEKDLNVYQLTDTIQAGDKVLIYNAGNQKAAAGEMSGYYLAGKDETVLTGTDLIATKDDKIEWTVVVNEDGSYSFTQESVALAGKQTPKDGGGYYNNVSLSASDMAAWMLTKVSETGSAYYMQNRDMVTAFENDGGHVYLEWYANKTAFSMYDTSRVSETNFGFTFYKLVREAETPGDPTPSEGNTYGRVKVTSLVDGDEVILYNAGVSKGLASTVESHGLAGVSLTSEESVITTDNTSVVWTVGVNGDGTITFTQGTKKLAGIADGTYRNVVTNETGSDWVFENTATDGDYHIYVSGLEPTNNKDHVYLDWFAKYNYFSLNSYSNPGTDANYIFSIYKRGADPEVTPAVIGDLVTSLDQLTDGVTVAIYSPGHKTAISTRPNGDWYLKANDATIENGKVVNFTSDYVWQVQKNANGTYTFVSNDDNTKSITVWPSDTYAEVTVNPRDDGDNTWTLTPAKTANCFYMSSPSVSGERGPAYIEAYVRNEFEVFSGYFTNPSSNKFTESEFALQFYLVDPEDAIEAYDDGEWDGVLTKGQSYVFYNANAQSAVGLWKEANYSMDAIPTTIEGGKANAGNGAYVFKVDTMGRYYSFEVNGKFLATNNDEELLFVEPNEDGSAPENAKWFLKQKEGGYIIYNKDASYNGTPVCIEYYSSVFSGWTFSTKNEVGIYLFNFYPLADGIEVREDTVQVPSVKFDCEDTRFFEQDYKVAFTLDDLAESISSITITYTANGQTTTVTEYEASADGKGYSFTIPASALDGQRTDASFTVNVTVNNSYDITYTGQKTVTNVDEPFFEEMTPAPNGQTGDDKRPVISVKIGNAGENPVITMQVNGTQVEAVFENGVLSYQPAEDMADGRVTVSVSVTRADQVRAEKSWYFTVGDSEFQKYFGQLHSHTTYSDGSGTLETALDYISSIPESANVQFVAFTDHSNYFDTTSAANPADALNDQSQMTDASRALWNTYKNTVASFNADPDQQMIAIAGFEMTWSGGPGHINTFGSDGLVSRNNAALNNKSGDAGMKLYYETVNKGGSMNQFNHPGNTFGNFTDFSYWSEETDAHMFLVEVGNGEGQIGAGGYYPSYEQYTMALDKGWHVAPTNNQDNHKGRWGNANDARDVVLATNLSEEAIYDAIRNLRVYATEDKNLDISFTANGEVMGTIFEERPETLNVVIDLYDPDDTDSVAKVELISDGGVVSYSWTNAEEIATGELTAAIAPEHNYYYVRVTQADGDLAVTAPVWVGSTMNMGIASVAVKGSESKEVYKDEPFQLTTTLFNNGESEATVTSLSYEIKGGEVLATDTTSHKISAGGTIAVDQTLTIDTAKLTTITVTAVIDGTTFTQNIELDVIDRTNENTVTPIADVRAASDPDDTGYRFLIEGVVTSNASGYDKDTAFFDCIYVQDETGGLCCFPVSGEYKIGDKVRIVGHTDFYQGEPELQVKTIEVIGSGTVEPTEITAAQLTDRSAEGKLVTLRGTVESFEEANGLVQTIMVKDANGDLGRVFIDGYITTGKEVENLAVGATISATGLASYDNTWPDTNSFPRIRIRDRADVVCGTEAPGVRIIGISLGLNGSIDLNIYVKPDAGISAEQLNGLFLLDGEAAELGSPDASGNYKLIVKKDAPTMTAEVELTLSDESIRLLSPAGEEIDSYKTSIFGYLTFAKEYYQNDPDKVALLRLMDVMMAYCYYSQQACTYDTSARAVSLDEIDPSVIADVTADAVNDYTIQLDGAVEGLSFYGTSLIVNSETTYRLYFKLEDGASADDYSFQVNGTDVTAQVKGSYLFVDVVGIVAKNLNKTVTVTVTKGESALTIASAPLSYVRNALNGSQDEKTLNVAKAVFRYWQTAATYFMH